MTEARELTEEVVAGLRDHFPGVRVKIQVEPCGRARNALCRAGCFVPDDQEPVPRSPA